MVRYPHKAVIAGNTGSIVDGEFVPGTDSEKTVQGRFEASNNSSRIKLNSVGNEVVVRGVFYCQKQQLTGTSLKIDSLGLDLKIICIEHFQNYTAVYV